MKLEIVAEVSCNHRGSLDTAILLIKEAKNAGADAVKFQFWTPGSMVLDRGYKVQEGPWVGRSLAELYETTQTPLEWIPALMQAGREIGIEVFGSVFDVDALKVLEDQGCPRYKIASFELTDLPLIRAVAATGKPIILSTGMADEREIGQALEAVGRDEGVTLLHCSSAYPAPLESLNLQAMVEMGKAWGLPVGFSDHTIGTDAAAAATAMGAVMIEKHLTTRFGGGEDAKFSADPVEFWWLVEECRKVAQMKGLGIIGCNPDEEPHRALRRSLYFAWDMDEGVAISPDSVRTARPALGLAPARLPEVIGRTLTRAVRRGEPVIDSDLK